MLRLQLHKTPLAILGIQVERTPNKQRRRNRPEQQAEPRVETGHIEHDDQHEQSQQSAREEEEVLAFQALELGAAADTFVDTVFGHTLQEERAENGSCNDQEDAGAEPRSGGLLRVGIAGIEFAVDFHAADKPYDSADGIDKFGGRVEIRGNHIGRLSDAADAIALGINARITEQQ